MADEKKIKNLTLSLLSQGGRFLENNFFAFKNVYHKNLDYLKDSLLNQVEDIMAGGIVSLFPGHGLIFTHHPDKNIARRGDYVWTINGLDGRSHFFKNIPIYTLSLTVECKKEIIFAGVNYPSAGQLFFAERGRGSFLNGLPIKVSPVEKLDQAYIFVELPEKDELFESHFFLIKKLGRLAGQLETFRIGSLGQCLVASGAFDAYVDFSGTSELNSQKGSIFIAEQAGAKIINLDKTGTAKVRVAVSNPLLHGQLKEFLNL